MDCHLESRNRSPSKEKCLLRDLGLCQVWPGLDKLHLKMLKYSFKKNWFLAIQSREPIPGKWCTKNECGCTVKTRMGISYSATFTSELTLQTLHPVLQPQKILLKQQMENENQRAEKVPPEGRLTLGQWVSLIPLIWVFGSGPEKWCLQQPVQKLPWPGHPQKFCCFLAVRIPQNWSSSGRSLKSFPQKSGKRTYKQRVKNYYEALQDRL